MVTTDVLSRAPGSCIAKYHKFLYVYIHTYIHIDVLMVYVCMYVCMHVSTCMRIRKLILCYTTLVMKCTVCCLYCSYCSNVLMYNIVLFNEIIVLIAG